MKDREVEMDKEGFRAMLQTRKLSDEKIEASIALAERFEAFLDDSFRMPSAESAWAFSRVLVKEGRNTEDNYIALARYGRFTRNDDLYVAILELLDGAEAQANLHRKVGEVFGKEIRDEVFAGIGIAPLGLPSSEKPRFCTIEQLQDGDVEVVIVRKATIARQGNVVILSVLPFFDEHS
jgi:hypothetical protein